MISRILAVAIVLSFYARAHGGVLMLNKATAPITEEQHAEAERSDVVSLQGNIPTYGQFWTKVTLGNPNGKDYNLFLDTGFTDTLVFETGCTSCPTGTPFYSPQEVLTCNSQFCFVCSHGNTLCGFNETFASGQWVEGSVVRDYMSIGNIKNIRVTFGAVESVSPGLTFGRDISGLLGLAFRQLSEFSTDSVIGTLTNASGLPDTFSLCLTSENPSMTIGEDFTNETDWVFTPVVTGSPVPDGFWQVNITSITADGTDLIGNTTSTPAILDSGTTLVYFPQETYRNFVTLLNDTCSTDTPLVGACDINRPIFAQYCYILRDEQIAQYPTINITIDGIPDPFQLTPDVYLVPLLRGGRVFRCLGITTTSGLPAAILGDVFMQNFHIAFDRAGKRIGFAPVSTCPVTGTSTTGLSNAPGATDVNSAPVHARGVKYSYGVVINTTTSNHAVNAILFAVILITAFVM